MLATLWVSSHHKRLKTVGSKLILQGVLSSRRQEVVASFEKFAYNNKLKCTRVIVNTEFGTEDRRNDVIDN